MKLFLLIWILNLVVVQSWAVEVDQTQYKKPSVDYLDAESVSQVFDFEKIVGITEAKQNNGKLLSNSADIFRFIENTLIIGRRNNSNLLASKFGHAMLGKYYSVAENSTQFNELQTAYIPAALGFEGEKIWNYFKTVGSDQNKGALDAVFNCSGEGCHKIQWPEEKPTQPIKFVQSIKSYLENTAQVFRTHRVSEDFVTIFAKQIQDDYLVSLSKSEKDLITVNESMSLKHNISTVIRVVTSFTFLPEKTISTLKVKLSKALEYANMLETVVENEPYAQRILKVIASIWLDLTPEQRAIYIKPANEVLYNRLVGQSESYLKWLSGRTSSLDWSGSGFLEFADAWTFDAVKNGYMKGLSRSCHANVYQRVVEWVSWNSEQKNNFKEKDAELYSILITLKDRDIRKDLITQYLPDEKRFDNDTNLSERFISDIENICLRDVQILLDKAINKYAFSQLDEQIRLWGPEIEKIVAAKTLANVAGISEHVKTREGFESYFKSLAFPILQNMLFKKKTLSGLERTTVALKVTNSNSVEFEPYNLENFETGAETLGASLSVNYQRFLGLNEIESKKPESDEFAQVLFTQINKMLAMIGFRNMDRSLTVALHRRFWGEPEEIDVFKYDCSPRRTKIQARSVYPIDWREDCSGHEDYYLSNYQIPDKLLIENAFTPKDSESEYYASVLSQAELIRGASLMLNYFKDWKGQPDDYDLGMGSRKMGAISVFPRSAFVNLSVGLVSTPIRSFKKPNSPIRLFNVMNDKEIKDWGKPLQDVEALLKEENPSLLRETLKGVVHVAYSDQKKSENVDERLSNIIKTKDMALMIVAFDEFLTATDGIQNTEASVINPKHKKKEDRENLKAILEGRELISKMMAGMAFFLLGRSQDTKEGGFFTAYDLDTSSVVAEKKLTDQIYAIEALLRVFKRYRGQGYWINAVETYYFMNKNMWDSSTGFYRFDSDDNARLVTFLKMVNILSDLETYIPTQESKDKLRAISQAYEKSYLNWASKALQ